MDLSKIFMGNMKKWRKKAGISQEILAERCNSAHSYIRQIECGIRTPSFSFIEKIAGALNVPPYQLFFDETMVETNIRSETNFIEAELLDSVSNDIHKAFVQLHSAIM